jgi:glycosyltransferase involved in cell wall biosynthesis
MKIIFNLFNTGLGNNGGSSTIVNSANTLVDLGHEVIIADTGKNKHTWTPLKANHIIVNDIYHIPHGDVLIATGFNSVHATIKAPKECGTKFHWIRGFELWNMSEDKLLDVLRAPTYKMVNSSGLKKLLDRHNISCEIIRPGYDFDEIYPLSIRDECKKPKIGALYNSGTKRKTKRVEWVFEAIKRLRREYVVDLFMFGSESGDSSPSNLISYYIKEPTTETKNKLYNMCDIWIAPTELEGLHIPPAEAMLTECPVVGTNIKMLNGMDDYLHHGKTGLVSENNIDSFVENIETLLQDKSLRVTLGSNARKEILSLGSRLENMYYMVEFFEYVNRRV